MHETLMDMFSRFPPKFLLDPSWTFINHGAFGAVARRPAEVKCMVHVYPCVYIDVMT